MCKKKEWNNRSGDKTKKHASKLPPPLLYNVHVLCFLFCWLISLCSLLFLCLCYLCLFAKGQESKRMNERATERERISALCTRSRETVFFYFSTLSCMHGTYYQNIYTEKEGDREKNNFNFTLYYIITIFKPK